jgi:hypothetical protein
MPRTEPLHGNRGGHRLVDHQAGFDAIQRVDRMDCLPIVAVPPSGGIPSASSTWPEPKEVNKRSLSCFRPAVSHACRSDSAQV